MDLPVPRKRRTLSEYFEAQAAALQVAIEESKREAAALAKSSSEQDAELKAAIAASLSCQTAFKTISNS